MPDGRDIRLLLVEDDEDDYVLACALLKEATPFRFFVDWASTADEARRLFQQQRHDLCLMDYRLGSESGVNLVREALALGFPAPIIMLSGQEDTGVEIAAARAGAVDYLAKDSLEREQILRSIRYALARREIQAERDERLHAEAANQAKTEFLAMLSHEIRTPLTAIIGNTELLMYHYAAANPELRKKLGVIKRNGAHLLSLLNDTLDLSKIEAGKLEMDRSDVELAPYVTEVVTLLQDLAVEKGLMFTLNSDGPLPRTISTDPMRLRQILLNLLGNALKFTHKGGVGLHLRCLEEGDGHLVEFQVRDTGIGIQESKLRCIFDPFTQLDSGSLAGSGLGLTISQKLAQKLGGSISASSTPGQGSTFTLRIDPGPVTLDPDTLLETPRYDSEVYPALPFQLSGKVLVVDDVTDIRDMLEGLLGSAGIASGGAADAATALHLLRQPDSPYTMVVMDLNMPGMDGYEALREIQRFAPLLPVIALTAAGLKGERERCLEAGFIGFLPKPVTLHSLLDAITRAQRATTQTEAVADTLVVEDDADANAALCELLTLLGRRAVGAHSLQEARELFGQHRITLVIADEHLPDGSGRALCEELHRLAPALHLCLASGDDSLRGDNALPAGVAHALPKPLTLRQLERLLQTV
ncbi:MAG TPA: response regulator [Hyphomicrobiales bacterium]|nr:response regulator [Hyphomicrobiales bacterium]